jgi:hypothetical protein
MGEVARVEEQVEVMGAAARVGVKGVVMAGSMEAALREHSGGKVVARAARAEGVVGAAC